MSKHKGKVGLYRFYNWNVDIEGELFRLCEACIKLQPIPENCSIRKIATEAVGGCQGDFAEVEGRQ